MFVTRWKMMAGLLAVSLGGLAAMAGPCSKNEPAKGPPPPDMPTASAPAPASPPMMPPPTAPSLPPIPAAEPAKPSELPPPPAVLPVGGTTIPAIPPMNAVPSTIPAEPPTPTVPTAHPPEPTTPNTDLRQFLPPMSTSAPMPPVISSPAVNATAPPMSIPADPMVDCPPPSPINHVNPAAAVSAVAQAKYRILLRVGEGEPLFEVRSGDHLILKVVCEKVDVKSPEKGQGLSAVKAYGKVRFAGFGAEGTCDELNFLAGTGEVAMAGHVMIRVKDKLGRVESEVSAESLRYRIDPHTTTGNGQLKP